jgi:acyl-CoA synthetase (AMP-forming)/AMP-acid ligase II
LESLPKTLPELLERAASESPDRGIALYDGRGRPIGRRGYAELRAAALTTAARYSALGVGPGDRVLVGLPTSWEWMDAWLGALVLGALPAALAPPGAMGSSEGYAARVQYLVELLGASRLVSSDGLRAELQDIGAGEAAAALITPDELQEIDPAPDFKPSRPDPEQTAFLQFTSGSTGHSRAVMIPHRAAIHNNCVSDEAIGLPQGGRAGSWADGMVAWLPMHHDMGLVGCLFLSISLQQDLRLLNPTTFLARPRLWLEALASVGTTFSPAPNFGYQLCVERIRPEQLAGLDLSGWRAAMTGAEMVRPDTMAAFVDLLEPFGFRREAVVPCYGLAEGTLAVTFDVEGRGLRTRPVPAGAGSGLDLSEVVSVGRPVRDTELLICAPDGTPLSDGQVGEVRAKGPGIYSGYYNDPAATADGLKEGWLCTGDVGFLHEGELYLTGRVKDLLIIRGNNIMPHELEWLAESAIGGGGSQRCGAFSIARGADGEQVVLVIETTEKDAGALEHLARNVKIRIGRALSLPVADVAFVRRGRIPKTTSGKVQRRELRARYIEDRLERLNG